jgi:hypothetical protein
MLNHKKYLDRTMFLLHQLMIVLHVTGPQAGCPEMLENEECRQFLTPEIFSILMKRLMEAKVPEGDRVYCPYANCSTLMRKSGFALPEQVLGHFISSALNVTHCNYVSFSTRMFNFFIKKLRCDYVTVISV